MKKYFGKFNSAEAVQDAVNNEELSKPYVALVGTGNTLDYNTLSPISYMGTWTDDGEGTYTFTITEEDLNYWGSSVKIGELLGVYMSGAELNMDVLLTAGGNTGLVMSLFSQEASLTPEYTFEEGVPDMFVPVDIVMNPDASEALNISYDGAFTFVFTTSDNTLNMTTIDPEYPSSEPDESE